MRVGAQLECLIVRFKGMASAAKPKRKGFVLSIKEKVEILKLWEHGLQSYHQS